MEDEAIGGFGSQQKRNSSENQPVTNSTVPFKQPNTASSTHLNGSSVQGPHQPSRLGPSIPNPRLNGPPLTDPSKVKMMLSPTGSAGKPQLGVNRPSMMSPPAVSAPSQNAGSSPILPSTPAIPTSSQYADRPAAPTPTPVPPSSIPAPTQNADSTTVPTPPPIPTAPQEADSSSVPTPPPIPAPTQNADSSSVPTPPPVPPIQEMERSLPISTPSQPKNAPTVSVIQPPAHGIKNDLSGSISYAVGDSSAPHALPGTTSIRPTPGNSILFFSVPTPSSFTSPLDKEIQRNNPSALSNSTFRPLSPGSHPSNRPLTKPSRFNSPGPKPKNSPPPVPDHPPCSNSQKPSPPIPPPPSSIPAPTQNADSSTVPTPPPSSIPAPTQNADSTTVPTPPPAPTQNADSTTVPTPPPAPTQNADSTTVPTPPPAPTQNADSSSVPTPPPSSIPAPTQNADSTIVPPPPLIPAPTQNADSTTVPTPPPIPTAPQEADSTIVPPPPPIPSSSIPAPIQELELSLPKPQSKNALTVSVIQPPAHGIKNDPSGPTAYTVGNSSAPHALPGATSMKPTPGNSPLFCSNSAVPSSIMSRGKELSLNQNNIHSQSSNAPDGSTLLPPPPPVPPVGAEIGQAENQKSSNLPLEDPTLIDRHNLSESIVPTAPKLLPSHSNGNTNELDTQNSADGNSADGSNGEVSNEDSSKSDDDTLSDNSNSKSSCGPGCTCY